MKGKKLFLVLAVMAAMIVFAPLGCVLMVASIGSAGGSATAAACSIPLGVDATGGSPTAVALKEIPKKPYDLLKIYMAAQDQYHMPWNWLAGINYVETRFGTNLSTSSAGAIGWMQFEPATWQQYAVDANHDGKKDPYNPWDAIFSAANMLVHNGAPEDMQQAVLAYNHSEAYYQAVMAKADEYAATTSPTGTAMPASVGGATGSAKTGGRTIPGPETVLASVYGGPKDPSSTTTGAYGDSLVGQADFAELSVNPGALDYSALGNLPPHTLLRVTNPATGVTLVMEKMDVGAGGPAHPKIDLWWEAARVLGIDGLGDVQIAPAQPGDVASLTPIAGGAGTTVTDAFCGASGISPTVAANGYVTPFSAPVIAKRVDQGVDYCMPAGTQIRAIGDAQVISVIPNWYSGQPFVWYKLLSGSLTGRYIYVSEEINIAVTSGKIPAGTTIATFAQTGTCIEMGFATASGVTLARVTGTSSVSYVEGQSTAAGVSFNRLMVAMGVPTGQINQPVLGTLAGLGYP